MKILHVAVFTPQSTNVWQADAFESLGHDVVRYDYRQKAKDLDGKLGNENPKRDDDLILFCRKEKPDIILYSKCNQMDVRVVEGCGKIGKTVLWYMDFQDNINAELIQKMKKSNYVFCGRWHGVEEGKKHNKNVYKICEGYDPKVHFPRDIPKTRDISFIGNMRSYRERFRKTVNFDVITNAYNEEHAKVVSETKINLNFTEGDGTSDRSYKILAAGGFLLSSTWKNIEEDFEVGKDLITFTTPSTFKECINYYLNHKEEREKIAQHGYETVKQYDNIHYASSIIEVVSCKN